MESKVANATDPLTARAQSGVTWFYWIAGLSLVNSIVAATGSTWGFMAGLGMTQMVDGFALSIGEGARFFALATDVLIAGMFIGLGVWATRSMGAYMLGMIVYALDAGLFALASDWIGLAFHGLVLFFLWGGFNARRELRRMAPVTAPSGTAPAATPTATPATAEMDKAA